MQQFDSLRQLYESRRLEEAWQEYQRLLESGAADAEVHLLGALTARRMPVPDYREARRALERAEAANPAGVTLGKLWLSMGTLLREIGDTSAAIEYLEKFIHGIETYPDLRSVCYGAAHYNLGLAYRCARRYQDALNAYETAAAEFRQNDFPEYLRQCLQNMAWLQCIIGAVQAAEAALTEAEDLCKTDTARWHQRIGWAYLEVISGERTSALTRCESIIAAEAVAPPEVVSHAYWVAGQVALTLGQIDQAGLMADQAVSWSLKVKDDVRPMQDANALRREIYQTKVHKDQTGA
ncbi:MAG TPA: tetratricopeptide repeat protein [Symbiobacteriaceae bacterium]|nr:tetratricopeptide repeat protein [Symbiobacteriaceae bacterium]